MLLFKFVFLTLLGCISIFGASTENIVGKTASIPSWINQTQSRHYSIPTGRTIEQLNPAACTNFMPFVELGGRQYYFQTYFKANYFKSFQFCRDHGMDLLSIESKDENDEIINYVQENMTNFDEIWTSGTNLPQEGTYVWLSTGRKFSFTYWEPPNPDNSGNNEHCLQIHKQGPKNFVWNDAVCTNEYYCVCELR